MSAQNVASDAIDNELIAAAQAKGALTVRYSSLLTEMQIMASAFTEHFGSRVQVDRLPWVSAQGLPGPIGKGKRPVGVGGDALGRIRGEARDAAFACFPK